MTGDEIAAGVGNDLKFSAGLDAWKLDENFVSVGGGGGGAIFFNGNINM